MGAKSASDQLFCDSDDNGVRLVAIGGVWGQVYAGIVPIIDCNRTIAR